jgi:co-chaperonin GroES (HSP10)
MTHPLSNFTPHPDKVFVADLERGERKSRGGIIITDDDMKDYGIRPRWGQVKVVGANVEDVKVGDWVLVEHGRWTFGLPFEDETGKTIKIHHIDFPDAVLLVSEEKPTETFRL